MKHLKKLLGALALLLFSGNSYSQISDTVSAEPKQNIKSLLDFFKKADYHFYSRTFFMSTLNNGNLKDDFTLSQGGGLSIQTPSIAGFQLGFSGYFVFRLASSNLNTPDPQTGLRNRYEIGQYDVTNTDNFQNLFRLEDLFLRYSYKKNSITVGRMTLNTPFMNPQDGRMRPTVEEGVWVQINQHPKFGFNGGFIWAVSPRSTMKFYRMESSVGIYAQGLSTNGSKSNYSGNISSAGLAMGRFYIKPTQNFEINLWDAYFENVFNTAILELKGNQSISSTIELYQSAMYVRQDAVGNGGNSDPSKAYIDKNSYSNLVSAQFGLKTGKINWNVNYSHITGDGRFLNPREWGRDFLYTFMPRERNEGAGNLHAATSNFTYQTLEDKLKLGISYGYYLFPAITNARLNKYAMPSYHQVNFSTSYNFSKVLKGLEIKLLVAGKFNTQTDIPAKYLYNKVNMINFNLIFDIKI